MRAVCVRCGEIKPRAMGPCPACTYLPDGDDRPLSYLLSSHHLSDEELERAAERIRAGESVSPPPSLVEVARVVSVRRSAARVELTATQAEGDDNPRDRGLNREEKFLLVLGDILFTPLIGVAAWWGLRVERPVASRQALLITAPVAALLTAVWITAVVL